MSQDIFIGVDGGASKCKVIIEDAEGKLLGHAIGGPSNIRLSVQETWQNIITTVNNALQDTGIGLLNDNYNFHIGLGLAGTELESAVDEFLTQPHPFTSIRLESDAYTACLGAHNGKDGGMIIIGTGVVGLCIQGKETVQVGGWGFPYGDEGSGAWLGLEATRLTFQAHDGRADDSPLLHAIRDKFNNDFNRLFTWASGAQSTQFAQLAPLIFEHLDKKDPWAVHLVKTAAHEIDRVFDALEKRAANKQEHLPYSLFGGIVSFITPWLGKKLQSRLVSQQYDATKGAIFMIKRA